MSRTRKALVASGFTYAQWVLTAAAGLFLTRFLIHALGREVYGTWLATSALLGYAGLADLGILGVMPWLFAEADGANDGARMRTLVGHGLAAGVAGGAGYLLVALCAWALLPSVLHVSPGDREALRGPVLAMSLVTAVGYPLRFFGALRSGLQDYAFTGTLSIVQTLLGVGLVVELTLLGAGLYAVALGAAIPPLLGGAIALARTALRNHELLKGWPRLRWESLQPLLRSGVGQWLGSLGWQMAFASDGVIIASLGHRELVPVYVVTSRLPLTLLQLSWALPDNTAVGLAQLNAEGRPERVVEVFAMLLRFHLLTAGLIACGVLASNFGFVGSWVGPDLYGGATLNGVLGIDVIALSIAHGLMVPLAVLGRRLSVGLLTLLNGASHIVLALFFGRTWGLPGVALGTALSALITTIPGGMKLLAKVTPKATRSGVWKLAGDWSLRMAPCFALAIGANWFFSSANRTALLSSHPALLGSLIAGVLTGLVYLAVMRPVLRALPLSARMRRVFVALRLG
jgi:hypothetical protein